MDLSNIKETPTNVLEGHYGTVSEMSPEEIELVQSRMYPKQWSHVGFIAENESLLDLYTMDKKVLDNLGVTYQQISDKLKSVISRARKIDEENMWNPKRRSSLGRWCDPVLIDNYIQVYLPTMSCLGYQKCPFAKNIDGFPCCRGNDETKLVNVKNNKEIVIPNMLMSLLKTHNFFEGHTEYRTDPYILCSILGFTN